MRMLIWCIGDVISVCMDASILHCCRDSCKCRFDILLNMHTFESFYCIINALIYLIVIENHDYNHDYDFLSQREVLSFHVG